MTPAAEGGATPLPVPVRRLPHAGDLPLPSYATAGAAGLDLLAAVPDAVALAPGARALIPTGLALALPDGYEGQVRPRSGLALRAGVTVLNSPGTIDSDYRGEVGVLLVNLGDRPVEIRRGMRIAQLVVAAAARVAWRPVLDQPPGGAPDDAGLGATARGPGGFGSTGLNSNGADPIPPSPDSVPPAEENRP